MWNQTKENWRKMAEWKWVGFLLLPFLGRIRGKVCLIYNRSCRFVLQYRRWLSILAASLFLFIFLLSFSYLSKHNIYNIYVENCRQAGSDVFGGCWLHRSCVLWWFYLSPEIILSTSLGCCSAIYFPFDSIHFDDRMCRSSAAIMSVVFFNK